MKNLPKMVKTRRNGKNGNGNGKKKAPRKRRQKAFTNAQERRVVQLARKEDDKDTEFKYVYTGSYIYSGDVANAANSFWKDNTGMIKTMDATIARGTAHNQRVGDQITLRRIMLQYVLRWPLVTYTTNWNGLNSGAVSNSQLTSKDLRLTLPGRIYLVRLDHADGSYAGFQHYLDCFKRPYTLREEMDNDDIDMKKQEVKILASKRFVLRRSATLKSDNTLHVFNKLVEDVIQVPQEELLRFDKSGVSNVAQNWRYAVVVKFGHLADQFITIDEKYNPIMLTKMHYWYTDE